MTNFPIVVGVILLIVVGGGGYYLGMQNSKTTETIQQTNVAPSLMITNQPAYSLTSTPIPNATTLKLYNNQRYGFTLQYPADYRIECADSADLCQGGNGGDQSGAINFYPPKEQDNGYGSISVVVNIIKQKKQQ